MADPETSIVLKKDPLDPGSQDAGVVGTSFPQAIIDFLAGMLPFGNTLQDILTPSEDNSNSLGNFIGEGVGEIGDFLGTLGTQPGPMPASNDPDFSGVEGFSGAGFESLFGPLFGSLDFGLDFSDLGAQGAIAPITDFDQNPLDPNNPLVPIDPTLAQPTPPPTAPGSNDFLDAINDALTGGTGIGQAGPQTGATLNQLPRPITRPRNLPTSQQVLERNVEPRFQDQFNAFRGILDAKRTESPAQ